MLRTRNDQPTLWESVLPDELLRLPAELARVDALLDDEAFFTPFRAYFDPAFGRPSIPIETYLRLMFLKFRYRLGFESLCAEVADSISWRRFARIGIDGRVPHPTTLMKITTRCGSEVIEQLNEALLAKAAEAKLLRVGKVRADTTVVSANVDYPTDTGLLAKAVGKIGRLVRRVKAAGGATRTRCPDHTRAAGRRARQIASKCGCEAPRPKRRPSVWSGRRPPPWPVWPNPVRWTPERCCVTPVGPWPRPPGGGPGSSAARSTTSRPPSTSPPSWSARPVPASPA
jgi:IS5 family transposase